MDCRVRFATIVGRVRHLRKDKICSKWWKQYLAQKEDPPDDSVVSSEFPSDEDNDQNEPFSDMGIPMDLDLGTWPEGTGANCEVEVDIQREDSMGNSYPRSATMARSSGDDIVVEAYEGAAAIISEGKNQYAQLWDNDEYHGCREDSGTYYPFSGAVEWEVVQWLHALNVSIDRINQFFKLHYVGCIPIHPARLTLTVST